MRAAIFKGNGRIAVEEGARPTIDAFGGLA
jgi:hypothetical protein